MAASQGHARRFANPGTFVVAGERLRMDVAHMAPGEGARVGCTTVPGLLITAGCAEGSEEGRAAARLRVLQIRFVGTVVTRAATGGLGRGGMMPTPSFVAVHFCHSVSVLSFICS